MALQSDFRVVLSSNHRHEPLDFTSYDRSLNMADLKRLPTFKEDLALNLQFSVHGDPKHWKLFILGIDGYYDQINGLKLNLDYRKSRQNGSSCRYYFVPGGHSLYNPLNQNVTFGGNDHSLIPNAYTVKVTDGTHWYYSHFAVKPKEFSFKEWHDMITQISNVSAQLAIEHTDWQLGFISQKEHISQKFADELARLADKLRISLHFILTNARYDVAKQYRWVNVGQEHEIDARSIREMSRHPLGTGKIYAPYRYTNFNTADNRWVKLITKRLLKATGRAVECYAEMLTVENPASVKGVSVKQQTLLRLRNYLGYVLNGTFLSQVSSRPPKFVPKGLIYSPRYNQYYRIYVHLSQIYEQRLVVEPNQYRYRNTDKLYEFWVFIRAVSVLTAQGYRPVKGWGCGTGRDKWLLTPDTRVTLYNRQNHVDLQVVYDDDLQTVAGKRSDPLVIFGSGHQRPDVRIDIFHENIDYWGTLVIDAKYKDLRHVINTAENSGQLTDYYLKGFDRYNNRLEVAPHVHAVIKTLAVYTGTKHRTGYSVLLSRMRQLGVSAEVLRPDDEPNLRKFSRDLSRLIGERVEAMAKLDQSKLPSHIENLKAIHND